jgi:hypothetical protein
MMPTKTLLTACTYSAYSAGLTLSSLGATVVSETFEGSTAGSATPPAGWSLITAAGAPTYATSAAGLGSNGAGGSTGLAGQVSSTTFPTGLNDLPGAYLVSSTSFDLNFALTVTFDFQIVQEGTFGDIAFVVGDVANGLSALTGESLGVKFSEAESTGVSHLINDGAGSDAGRLDTEGLSGVLDDTWYTVAFNWTPTSGLTGDVSVTLNDFSSDIVSLSATGYTYTYTSANAELGIGSVNDTIRFDNVSVTGTVAVPEPSSTALLGLGGLPLILRRSK